MRILIRLAAAALILCLAAPLALWLVARPRSPDSFYTWSDPLTQAPGTLLRAEPLAALPPEAPAGTQGWRILYTTTRADGRADIASAIVLAPAATAPLPLVAYAHGTTGIAPGCAPSLLDDPFPNVPAFAALLAQGWAYVGTDYPGLGTSGGALGHLYLVGEDAARAVLDSIRAAHQLTGTTLAPRTAIWGHSQGGHAALWAGQRAASYASELHIAGIAAISPASDLPALIMDRRHGGFGKVLTSYVATAYAGAYPDLDAWAVFPALSRLLARDMAGRCLDVSGAAFSLFESWLIPRAGMFPDTPATAAFSARLAQNTPLGPFAAPVLIGQGEADDTVPAAVQTPYATRLCAAGATLTYRLYAGEGHVSITDPTSPLTQDLITWTANRFAGRAATTTCP